MDDVMESIIGQLHELRAAGLIGPAAMAEAGTALLDAAQDAEVAA